MKLEGIKKGWYTPGGELYGDCGGTYCFIPYERIPALNKDLFKGNFQWLTKIRNKIEEEFDESEEDFNDVVLYSERSRIDHLGKILDFAKKIDINIPNSFQIFLKDINLQKKIPTCTACWLELSDEIIPLPNHDDYYMLRFLNDQQVVLLWYLCFNRNGEHCIVVSPYFYEKYIQREIYGEKINIDELLNNTYYCAPSFEEFIYRFWLENTIWFNLDEGLELNEVELEYMKKIKSKQKDGKE